MTDGIEYELLRMRTRDGGDTTVYLVRYPLATTRLRVLCFEQPTRLDHWCAEHGHPEAIVAGFFVRDPYLPLGEVRVDGAAIAHEPIAAPWGAARACVHVDGDGADGAARRARRRAGRRPRPGRARCSCATAAR